MTREKPQPHSSQIGTFGIGAAPGATIDNTNGNIIGQVDQFNQFLSHENDCFVELNECDLSIYSKYPYPESPYFQNMEELKSYSLDWILSKSQKILLLGREVGDLTSLRYLVEKISKNLHDNNFKIFGLKSHNENLGLIQHEISQKSQKFQNENLLFIVEGVTRNDVFSSIQPDILFPKIENISNAFLLVTSQDHLENFGNSIKKHVPSHNKISPDFLPSDQFYEFYSDKLNYREKLLCIGLTFFDGLPEDQFFAALEDVVARAWQKRDPSLKALDYCDLTNLHKKYFGFFKEQYIIKYSELTESLKVVEPQVYRIDEYGIRIGDPELRLALLKAAWKRDSEHSLRRQIISGVSVLVSLVLESVFVENTLLKFELYGTEERQQNLYRVVAKALCNLGQVSTDAVEAVHSALIQLSNSSDDRVREVAAQAVSGYYASEEYRHRFFRALENFYSFGFLLEKQYQAQNNNKSSKDESYYLNHCGATVALCIKHAVKYDSRNNLNQILIDWLRELSQATKSEIQKSFRSQTLPTTTALHLEQLYTNGVLQDILNQDIDFAIPVSQGIAQSFYQGQTESALEIMQAWYQDYYEKYGPLKFSVKNKSKPHTNLEKNAITSKDATASCKIAVINLTRAFFDYELLGDDTLSFDSSARIALEVFMFNTSEYTRRIVLVATLLLFNWNFTKFKTYFESLLSDLSLTRREVTVELAIDIYHNTEAIETVNRILTNEASEEKQQLLTASSIIAIAQEIKLGSSGNSGFSRKERINVLFKKTVDIVAYESEVSDKESKLRKAIFLAFQIVASSHLNDLIEELQICQYKNFDSEDVLRFMSSVFFEVYLDQRSVLSQDRSTGVVVCEGCEYPIWQNGDRPLTEIERYMLNWIKNSDSTRLKTLGLLSFIEFDKNKQLF
ncbi:MAG: hypothetical protein LAT50_14825 [Ectothiorhodospiraceae bacterium]|nr:hypothetical protein [Ectothiorhodospiraceae bacterium]